MFPENVFKRVPAELPAGQCSAVTRLKYVLWKLCLRRECVQNCGTMFFLQKRPDWLICRTSPWTMPPISRLHHNRHLSTSNHIQIASNHINQSHRNPIKPIKSHSNPIPIQNTFKSHPIPSNHIKSINPIDESHRNSIKPSKLFKSHRIPSNPVQNTLKSIKLHNTAIETVTNWNIIYRKTKQAGLCRGGFCGALPWWFLWGFAVVVLAGFGFITRRFLTGLHLFENINLKIWTEHIIQLKRNGIIILILIFCVYFCLFVYFMNFIVWTPKLMVF